MGCNASGYEWYIAKRHRDHGYVVLRKWNGVNCFNRTLKAVGYAQSRIVSQVRISFARAEPSRAVLTSP
jgi:hypothetical protein